MSELQTKEIKERCYKCKLPADYKEGRVTLEQARKKCSNCHFETLRLYKFDIVMQLFAVPVPEASASEAPAPEACPASFVPSRGGTGKKETYSKRYGTAITQMVADGKTTREIASLLGISPTSVTKVKRLLGLI